MPRFDAAPKNDQEQRELIYEVQKMAAADGIRFTYKEGNVDARGELIAKEINIMDTIQLMNFRDLDTKEDRIEYMDYIHYLDKECYLSITGYHEKLHRLDHVFKSRDDGKIVDIDTWRKLKAKRVAR